jgi:endonuclease/exonuclease/phosphatase family metal-dependent hydrolase
LADAVRLLDVDVLACQEVDYRQPRSGGVDQTLEIVKAMGAPYARFAPTVLGTPGEPGWTAATGEPAETEAVSISPDVHSFGAYGFEPLPETTDAFMERPGPAYGVTLVSRRKVEEWYELRLPPARGRFPLVIPGRPPRMIWLRDEPRVALAARLAMGVTVVCTHLSFVPGVNLRQLRQVRRWLEGLALPGPVVVMGDMNLPPLPVRRATGWTPLVTAATFPGWRPGVQLDHVLGVGLLPGTMARGELAEELPVGDHRAVRVFLDLPGENFAPIADALPEGPTPP